MSESAVRVFVSGRVQGVGFRYFTYRQATKLELTGYVCNLSDGRVEIVAIGQRDNVEQLLEWLNAGGPPSAKVEHIAVNEYSGEPFSTFKITH